MTSHSESPTPEPTPQDWEDARTLLRGDWHNFERKVAQAIARARHAGEVAERASWVPVVEAVIRAWDGGIFGDATPGTGNNAAKWMGLGNHDEGAHEPAVKRFYDALVSCRAAIRSLAPDSEGKP